MKSFKIECDIEDENGRRKKTVYYYKQCKSEEEAEKLVKHFFINKGVVFYGAVATQI